MAYNSDVQWIDIQLDKALKEKLKAWFDELPAAFDPMADLMNKDYKVSIGWDKRNNCYACWLVPIGEKHRNAGCILTSRSNDWVKAVYAAYWRSEILKKGNWWVAKKEAGTPDDWDL